MTFSVSQYGFIFSYSFKVAAGLYWAKHHCHDVDYIIQVHDDVMIRRDTLIPYLDNAPREGFIGGDCATVRFHLLKLRNKR